MQVSFVLLLYDISYKLSLGLKQSHYIRSRVGNHFYGTEYEICADFGLVGNTKKNIVPIMCNFLVQMLHYY